MLGPDVGLAAIWVTLIGLVVGCFLVGCSSTPAACGPEALARIEAAYLREAVQACAGYTVETCPALPAIDQRYQALRADWVRCGE